MPKFSKTSLKRLKSCDDRLQRVFKEVIKTYDCTIIKGHRGQAEQNFAVAEGNSQLKWPTGKHNKLPSLAVDASPYPIIWKETERFVLFAGFVLGTARQMGIKLRWGGDWNMNWELSDNKFDDLVHFELI